MNDAAELHDFAPVALPAQPFIGRAPICADFQFAEHVAGVLDEPRHDRVQGRDEAADAALQAELEDAHPLFDLLHSLLGDAVGGGLCHGGVLQDCVLLSSGLDVVRQTHQGWLLVRLDHHFAVAQPLQVQQGLVNRVLVRPFAWADVREGHSALLVPAD